jgi:hypothetical protein
VQGKQIKDYGKKQEKAKRNKMKNISLQALVRALREEQNVDLPGNQEKIDVAEPKGKITKADFEKLRSMKKEGQYKHSIDQLLKIVQTKKAGPEYKKALMDLINLAKKKTGKEIHSIADLKQALDYEEPKIREGADHEVAMAMSSLKEIVSNASQLMDKLGGMERDIPGWIQDHITNAENYIEQANQGFHELQ